MGAVLEIKVRHGSKGRPVTAWAPDEDVWGESRFDVSTIYSDFAPPQDGSWDGCDDCLAIDDESSLDYLAASLEPSDRELIIRKMVNSQGNSGVSLLLCLFNWMMMPLLHFTLLSVSLVGVLVFGLKQAYAPLFVWIFAATTFLITGLTAVWLRRKMATG